MRRCDGMRFDSSNRPYFNAYALRWRCPGLLKSTDGGATWNHFRFQQHSPQSRRIAPISSFVVSPINSNLVLAAFGYNGNGASFTNGNAGVYRSLDAGQTWSPVLLAQSAHKVLFDPQNPSIAYATVGLASTGCTNNWASGSSHTIAATSPQGNYAFSNWSDGGAQSHRQTISGTDYVNFGWVVTPQPNIVPIDGSTIAIHIDGVAVGHPT
jgi:hypothetical protein